MQKLGKRYNHFYNGQSNSRGKRYLSKLHKGINSGDVEKAFKEVELLGKEKR
jgi:hypothetical protein